MNSILHKANSRGFVNHGWLNAKHSFSFANYYNPERMHFGVLRVLNDDTIAPSMGFGTHPHDNMEIITIPLHGDLEHKDNMGNGTIIKNGDIQVMSAGSGITHSEFNANADKEINLLQIWLYPNQKNVKPRYDQVTLKSIEKKNALYQILSPNKNEQGVWIHQNAWSHLGHFDAATKQTYQLKDKNNGLYVFIIEGSAKIEDQELNKRDALGLWNLEQVTMEVDKDTEVLLMEVPMHN
jgi:hypothetical protein